MFGIKAPERDGLAERGRKLLIEPLSFWWANICRDPWHQSIILLVFFCARNPDTSLLIWCPHFVLHLSEILTQLSSFIKPHEQADLSPYQTRSSIACLCLPGPTEPRGACRNPITAHTDHVWSPSVCNETPALFADSISLREGWRHCFLSDLPVCLNVLFP